MSMFVYEGGGGSQGSVYVDKTHISFREYWLYVEYKFLKGLFILLQTQSHQIVDEMVYYRLLSEYDCAYLHNQNLWDGLWNNNIWDCKFENNLNFCSGKIISQKQGGYLKCLRGFRGGSAKCLCSSTRGRGGVKNALNSVYVVCTQSLLKLSMLHFKFKFKC